MYLTNGKYLTNVMYADDFVVFTNSKGLEKC